MNLYAYAGNNPIGFRDPFGLRDCDPAMDPGCGAVRAYGEGRNTIIVYTDGKTTHEQVRSGGSRSWRNNNPGNMRNYSFSQDLGSIGEAGGFAVFGSSASGTKAVTSLLSTPVYQGLTMSGAVARYAPPTENDTRNYESLLKNMTGVDPGTRMNAITKNQLDEVAEAIKRIEGWAEGTTTLREVKP